MSRTVEAVFELRRFRALPVATGVAVVEVEGRFPGGAGRFTRRPELVVETPRGEVLHVPAAEDAGRGERWFGSFAVPVGAMAGSTFALGVRGVLVELPEPDLVEEADRLAMLAREANRLRHRLAVAEDEAARTAAEARARAEAEAALAAMTEHAQAVEAALEQERERAAQAEEAARADQERLAREAEEAAAAAAAERERLAAEAQEAAAAAQLERERLAAEAEAAASAAAADAEQDALRLREELAQLAETRDAERAQAAALQRRLDELEAQLAARGGEARDLRRPLQDPQSTQAFTPVDLADADADATLPVARADEEPTYVAPEPGDGEIRARSFLRPSERLQRAAGALRPATPAGEETGGQRPARLRVAPTEEHQVAASDEPLEPSPLRWIPIVALAVFVVILALLVF